MAKSPEPPDSLPSLIGKWWIPATSGVIERGRLIWAIVPITEQPPRMLKPVGRVEDTNHKHFEFDIVDTHIAELRKARKHPQLPIGALPHFPGETYGVYRTKIRPCLVVGLGGDGVPEDLRRRGGARYQSAPTLTVAPYFGADQDGKGTGWDPEFVKRIRMAEWPQYMWDHLPVGGDEESILRLDHLQPIAKALSHFEPSEYQLSEEAMVIVDEQLEWLRTGDIPADGMLHMYRSEHIKPPAAPQTGGQPIPKVG